MSLPLISVVITTYNYGCFIEEAIDSILSQDFPPDKVEIVIVDDGSTDDTSERVKKYGARIQYFYKPNGGQASALNFGVERAGGEIVVLLDADDYWLPGKMRRVVEEFEKHPEAGLVYNRLEELKTETGERRESGFASLSGDLRTMLGLYFLYVPHPTSCVAFRRSSLKPLLPVPEQIRMLADGYLVDLMGFLTPVRGIAETLTVYRLHGKNCYYADEREMPIEIRKSRLESRRILLTAMRKWLAEHGYDEKDPLVRAFTARWKLYEESDKFLLERPGRLQVFRHLRLYNRCYGPYMSRRLRMVNSFNAWGALLTGYEGLPVLEKWRLKVSESAKRILRPSAENSAEKSGRGKASVNHED